eukprot:3586883-Prymnesium_polylepis.1
MPGMWTAFAHRHDHPVRGAPGDLLDRPHEAHDRVTAAGRWRRARAAVECADHPGLAGGAAEDAARA